MPATHLVVTFDHDVMADFSLDEPRESPTRTSESGMSPGSSGLGMRPQKIFSVPDNFFLALAKKWRHVALLKWCPPQETQQARRLHQTFRWTEVHHQATGPMCQGVNSKIGRAGGRILKFATYHFLSNTKIQSSNFGRAGGRILMFEFC